MSGLEAKAIGKAIEAISKNIGKLENLASEKLSGKNIDQRKLDAPIAKEVKNKPDTIDVGSPIQNKVDGLRCEEQVESGKNELKEILGWPDSKFDKCTVDSDGVIHYKTDREDLEGQTSENGVPYERKQIEINGVKIEGVFPIFESAFTTELSPENFQSKAYAKECNVQLKEAVSNDPDLKAKFTEEQLNDIESNRTPTGYVWHHNEEPGKMELVKREDHDRCIGGAAHTGGNSLWGADSQDNTKKGESF